MAQIRVQLVGSLHHGGLVYRRLEQAGLSIVGQDMAHEIIDVEGDPNIVHRVVADWDGEGRVEVLA